ncbi:Aste57867_25010 [Aphanomyces stellatus]|uniref:Sulfhydryl oxidase n=1 Tax=Aphanomyces stellatus TaxID=120398 RepID=A0A485LTD5_9STRA|nr:hypothetical protein As57867_024932 [Aphanomyces stellatus]VFU01641.1 Aste57867_25010 [Aphanomyces stellatus]
MAPLASKSLILAFLNRMSGLSTDFSGAAQKALHTAAAMAPRGVFVCILAAVLLGLVVHAGKGNNDPSPLFKEGHPNITYLTDANWGPLVRDAKGGLPWLIDFYHPFCPHCKQFVPIYHDIAAHFKPLGIVNVGAMSCMDWEQCAVYNVKGFPTLSLWNFDKNMNFENKRAVGEHTKDEVLGLVAQLFREQIFNATGEWPQETAPATSSGPTTLRPIWEESTLPTNETTRIQDAAAAFVFGMREGTFLGRKTLDDAELDALKEWLRVVSLTFPGVVYRRLLATLYKQVAPIGLLTKAKWTLIFEGWQNQTAFLHREYIQSMDATEAWELLPTAFEGNGVSYYACEAYTCGQWTMFHMMTMLAGESASDELAVTVMATIRRFVKNFFTCVPCRKHFLEYNTLELVEQFDRQASDKKKGLYMWLWEMHNAVNKRIRHYQWPKPKVCPACGEENKWRIEQVEYWMQKTYGFEALKPKVVKTTTTVTPRPTTTTTTAAPPTTTMAPLLPPVEVHHKDDGVGARLAKRANEAKAAFQDSFQGPHVGFFAWYLVPVAAFVGYFVLKRWRGMGGARHHSHHV